MDPNLGYWKGEIDVKKQLPQAPNSLAALSYTLRVPMAQSSRPSSQLRRLRAQFSNEGGCERRDDGESYQRAHGCQRKKYRKGRVFTDLISDGAVVHRETRVARPESLHNFNRFAILIEEEERGCIYNENAVLKQATRAAHSAAARSASAQENIRG